MQIAQSEVLCLVDNNRVRIRYIDSTLDNSGCNQYIVVIIDKAENDLFQFRRLHLSVSDGYPAIRNVTKNHCFQFRKIGYTVVYQKNLPITTHLKVNGISYHLFTERMYLRLYRITVGRWS